jgi:predicted GNAT superfamily acetyltransferase
LKAQRTVALQRGYDRMKWSTSVLGSRNLYIYVTKLGATVVGYRPELYRQVRVGRPGESSDDEVEIELSLRRAPGRPRTRMPALWASAGRDLVMSETEVVENGLRRLTHLGPPPPGRICALELPWDVQTLERRCRGLAVEWQLGLRGAIPHLIERGYRGIALMPDRAEQRAFLVFRRAGDG